MGTAGHGRINFGVGSGGVVGACTDEGRGRAQSRIEKVGRAGHMKSGDESRFVFICARLDTISCKLAVQDRGVCSCHASGECVEHDRRMSVK